MTHLRSTAIAFGVAAFLAIVAACNTSTPPATTAQAAALPSDPAVSCDSLAVLALPNGTIPAAAAA